VNLPAGAQSQAYAYVDDNAVVPSPWTEHAAVFHLDGNLIDEVTGALLVGASDVDVDYVDDEDCISGTCVEVTTSSAIPILADPAPFSSSTLALVANYASTSSPPSEAAIVGLSIAGLVNRDGTALTRLGVNVEPGSSTAVARPNDNPQPTTLTISGLARQPLHVATVITGEALVHVSNGTTRTTPAGPLGAAAPGRLVVGADENIAGQRSNAIIDEVRVRTAPTTGVVVLLELQAMQPSAAFVVEERAP
jgi:hypothetical protein